MRRALKVGGRIGLAVWAGIDLCPPFAALRDAIAEVMGPEAAEGYARGPWGLHAPEVLADLVTEAGFKDVAVDERALPIRFEGGLDQLDRSLAASGLAAEIADLSSDRRAALTGAIGDNLRGMTGPTGAVTSHLTSPA